MADRLVLYEVDEKVSVITLNRPEKLNAISAELQQQLHRGVRPGRRRCRDQRRIAARRGPQLLRRLRHLGERAGRRTIGAATRPRRTSICASSSISRWCRGHEKAGHRLGARSCDGRRVRARHAVRPDDRRRQCELRRAGGAFFERRTGDRDADDHRLQEGAGTALFRRHDRRQDGARLGMVNRVVPLAELREASLRWAKRLSLISPEALYATKRAINRGADAGGLPHGALCRARRRRPALRHQDRIRPEIPRHGRRGRRARRRQVAHRAVPGEMRVTAGSRPRAAARAAARHRRRCRRCRRPATSRGKVALNA